ncbi:hypothetical protein CYR55_21055 [Chimaeribacter californicus]|uniref:Uncharacterized protein n=1 Tax=Chimaeribacter californicus TaxID=2060067 RepID=A0A2N5DW15_9GAMM|nr:hypothetical protein CYR55_21055 [Chimaeribacter californicus]
MWYLYQVTDKKSLTNERAIWCIQAVSRLTFTFMTTRHTAFSVGWLIVCDKHDAVVKIHLR